MQQYVEALQGEVASDPTLPELTQLRVMSTSRGRVIARALRDGAPVFIKQWQGAERAQQARAAAMAAQTIARNLGPGPYRVARCLDVRPRLGLIVVEEAPGSRLDRLKRDGEFDHRRIVRLASAWLARSTARSAQAGTFRSAAFVALINGVVSGIANKRALSPEGMKLVAEAAAALAHRAAELDGRPMTVSVGHGDFHGGNLHATDDDVVTAFDVEAVIKRPVAAEMAKFLTAINASKRAEGSLPGAMPADLPADIWDALTASAPVPEDEARDLVPLFIGRVLLRRLLTNKEVREAQLQSSLQRLAENQLRRRAA